jgi:type II secretion system protein N
VKFIPSRELLKSVSRYLLLGAVVFSIGIVWNFPYERASERLRSTLQARTRYRIDMEKLSPALPLGFVARNARVQGPGLFGPAPVDLTFSSLRVGLSLLAPVKYLFTRSLALTYAAERDKSRWTGSASFGKDRGSASLESKGWKISTALPLDALNPMLTGSEIKIDAVLNLAAEFAGSPAALRLGDLTAADGDLTATATAVTLENAILKELRFDKIFLEGRLEKSKLNLKSLTLSGPDVNGTLSGLVNVSGYAPRSTLDLDAKLTLSPKAEVLRTLVTTLGAQSGLKMTEDGRIAFKVAGTISEPQVRGY